MHTLWAPSDGGTIGDVGDKIANPRNINVRINVARSGRSLSNTTTTCWHLSCSSAASSSATNASRDPSGSMVGGSATKSVRPSSTASQGWRAVRKVSRSGGGPTCSSLGTSGPPQRPCAQRHVETVGWRCAQSRPFTTHYKLLRMTTLQYSWHGFKITTYIICWTICTT